MDDGYLELGNGGKTSMIVYVRDPGVFGVTISEFDEFDMGYVVKYYLDGIEYNVFLLEEEYLIYRQGCIGGMDV
jgi:hypothetical protein